MSDEPYKSEIWSPPVDELTFTEWEPTVNIRWLRTTSFINPSVLQQEFRRYGIFNGLMWSEYTEYEWREVPIDD